MYRGLHGALPAIQVNYDFYENVTVRNFDRIIEDLDKGQKPAPVPVITGALHERNKLETPLISKRFGVKDSRKNRCVSAERWLQSAGKGAERDDL